ncbi:hypothetical protein QQY79_01585 [Flavobacterium tructae]|uniref:primase-helicase family protein n=1 Tax=Flavobacterium tructae TaxID=1114873 RepID=UPI002551CF9B|nr:hypothetical protein [Flavobacterium tructae]MDL2141197.1 hypothetical protein [Flavobacterium tructae]
MTNQPYNLQSLWDVSDYGLKYFHEVYPDSVGKENKSKHFKTHNEESPSTTLSNKKGKGNENTGIYIVYNHSSKESLNAIDHVKKERNLEFLQACEYLFQMFGLSKAKVQFLKPETKFEPTEKPLEYYKIDYSKKIDNYQFFAPFLTPDVCKDYDFYGVNSYSKVTKTGKLKTVIANDKYPIFAYKQKDFSKMYEPNAPKGDDFLFKHHFLGNKPSRIIYGWDRLFAKVDFDEIERLITAKTKAKNDREKKDIQELIEDLKLDSVIIATGGSDGLNLASLGYNVIWFNSEAEIINSDEYYKLTKIVKTVYYVPDLDETGIKQAVTMGMQFINIKILWLPEYLKKENKKDLRDWVCKYKNEPLEKVQGKFRQLLSQALNFQFWDTMDKSVKLNPKKLLHFLKHKNFRLYKQPFANSDTGKEDDGYFIQIENNLITKTFPSDIKRCTTQWLDDNYHHINIYNMILRSPFFNQNSLKALPYFEYKRNNSGIDFQYYFFNNKAAKVTKDKIELINYSKNLDVNIWEEEKINHFVDLVNPFFETYTDELNRKRIKILDNSSNYLKVLINTSRIHWQKDADLTGRDTNIFNINSSKLDDNENYLQELHLLNKMYCVGYLLHQYKSASKTYMVLGVDFAGGTSVKGSYGGTGKSFLQKSIFSMLDAISIGGKTLKDDNFPMDGVTPKKRFVLFDDLLPYQPMEYFYNMITDNFIANQKGGVKYNIPFDDSAKVGATTNFAPEMTSSTKRRLLVYYNSDYYHEKTDDNNYPFSRKIADDFNDKNILTKEYSAKEWNLDYNFFLQCIQFFLQQKEKIEAPMDTLINKNAMMQIGDNTVKFFNEFFSDQTNLNNWIEKAPVFSYQKDELGNKANSSQKFSENLVLYCKAKQWKIELKKKKNSSGNSVPHFYISTTDEIMNTSEELPKIKEQQSEMNFGSTGINTDVDI